jgi:hypothetical protein
MTDDRSDLESLPVCARVRVRACRESCRRLSVICHPDAKNGPGGVAKADFGGDRCAGGICHPRASVTRNRLWRLIEAGWGLRYPLRDCAREARGIALKAPRATLGRGVTARSAPSERAAADGGAVAWIANGVRAGCAIDGGAARPADIGSARYDGNGGPSGKKQPATPSCNGCRGTSWWRLRDTGFGASGNWICARYHAPTPAEHRLERAGAPEVRP